MVSEINSKGAKCPLRSESKPWSKMPTGWRVVEVVRRWGDFLATLQSYGIYTRGIKYKVVYASSHKKLQSTIKVVTLFQIHRYNSQIDR